MEPPTFLTSEERKARDNSGEGENKETPRDLNLQVWNSEVSQSPDPEPQRSSKTPVKTPVRASVRTRIQEINRKSASASPGKVPQLKQTKLMEYWKKKSPKALKAREKIEKESEARPNKLQGALKSPLSGDSNHPGPEQISSKGPGPVPAARGGGLGRMWKKEGLEGLGEVAAGL